MNQTERRVLKRYPIKIDATIITPTRSVSVRTVDIGIGGIRVISPDPILPETDIALSLATREEILLSGSVLWTIEIQREETPPEFEMGIEADAFILKEQEAIGFADRETVVREIISRVHNV